MFRIDDREIKEFESDLKAFARQALPHATKNTLNRSAFETQKLARRDISVKMITRNKFTQQSVQVDQARSLIIARQAATAGSIADYMETQEFGGIESKTGSEGVSIATAYSAGQGMNSRPRTRLPRKPNRMSNIQLRRRTRKGANQKQKNIIAIQGAAVSGRKYVFLDFGRKKGIFRVVGGQRRPKIRMVWDMSEQSVTIPRNPWLKPAFDRALVLLPNFYKQSLEFQRKRLRLFD